MQSFRELFFLSTASLFPSFDKWRLASKIRTSCACPYVHIFRNANDGSISFWKRHSTCDKLSENSIVLEKYQVTKQLSLVQPIVLPVLCGNSGVFLFSSDAFDGPKIHVGVVYSSNLRLTLHSTTYTRIHLPMHASLIFNQIFNCQIVCLQYENPNQVSTVSKSWYTLYLNSLT